MTEVVEDLEQRRRALSPQHSFIVQAPAGSGKTQLLTQRYLRLLARVRHPEEIVAITFTRKAAAEMRGRIISALELAQATPPCGDTGLEQDLEAVREVLEQDGKYNWRLQDNPGRLRIQTIDSLCAQLTRQMPMLARFGAQPETVEDASVLYLDAATELLSQLQSDPAASPGSAVLLDHLDNNLPKIRDLLAGMMARREHWLRHLGPGVERENLEAALRHSVEAALGRTRRVFTRRHEDEFVACIRFAAHNNRADDSDSGLQGFRDMTRLPAATAQELPLWQTIAAICLTKAGNWRKRLDNKLFPATAEGRDWKRRLQELLAQLYTPELERQLQETATLPLPVYSDKEWQVINALCHVLILADARLRVLFGERGQMDFCGVAMAAIEALGREDSPTDLALQLDHRIRHVLVDEFQDVSINQYRLLQQLTAGWSEEDGHTLFLVGDPMQSIYRFREAEVTLFMQTWEQQRLGQVPLIPLRISVNFRSRAGIVDWVNEAFQRILPQQADSRCGAVAYAVARAFHGPGAGQAVQIHPILGDGAEAEAEAGKIVELVAAAAADSDTASTAILVRSRAHLGDIVPRLKARGLRFRAVEIEQLGRRPAIRDLLALTEALFHYADRVAWLAILRAPWCGLTLADLQALVGNDRDRTVWECMQDETVLQGLSSDGRQRLIRFRRVLQQYYAQERRRSLRRSVESVWMNLGGAACLEDETDLENARSFFELLEQFDEGGELGDRERFIARVDSLFAAADIHADASLQIMTIHKAKGLEFDTVILPGLGRGTRPDDARLLVWTEVPHGMQQELLLAPIKETGADNSPVYAYLQGLERQRQYYEEGRLLYVAATRARSRLHLVGRINVVADPDQRRLSRPRSGSLLAQLWPLVETSYQLALERLEPATVATADTRPPQRCLRRLHPDWALPAAPGSVVWHGMEPGPDAPLTALEYEWARLTIRHVGTVVHRYIRTMAEEGIEHWGTARIRSQRAHYRCALRQLGVPGAELAHACRRVEQALLNFVQDGRGRWLLSKHDQQQNEYALSGLLGGAVVHIIVDRTFVDQDGVRWIVDYKTSSHEGTDVEGFLDLQQQRYRPQLEKYAALFRNLDGRPLRLGLYFPLLAGWREWQYK